jgi:hypothetical protein
MKRVALVMGFGFGRANEGVADFVRERNNVPGKGPFHQILSQEAVRIPLGERGLVSQPMHGHHDAVYVDTLDAAGLALLKLKDLFLDEDAVEVEVLAHHRQIARAHQATALAKSCLSTRPAMRAFLGRVTLPELRASRTMPMNQWSWPPRHWWTNSALIYTVFDATAIAARFNRKRRRCEHNDTIYRNLGKINDELKARGVSWRYSELP